MAAKKLTKREQKLDEITAAFRQARKQAEEAAKAVERVRALCSEHGFDINLVEQRVIEQEARQKAHERDDQDDYAKSAARV